MKGQLLPMVLRFAVALGLGFTQTSLADECPKPELCLLQGRHPCNPDLLTLHDGSDGSMAIEHFKGECGSCMQQYHAVDGLCVRKLNARAKLLMQYIAKSRLLLGTRNHSRQTQPAGVINLLQQQHVPESGSPTTNAGMLPAEQVKSVPSGLLQKIGRSHATVPDSSSFPALRALFSPSLSLSAAAASTAWTATVTAPASTSSRSEISFLASGKDRVPVAVPHAAVMGSERMSVSHDSFIRVEASRSAGDSGDKSSSDGLGKLSHLLFFVLVLSACLLTAVLFTAAFVFWYRLRLRPDHHRTKIRPADLTESVPGTLACPSARTLPQSARCPDRRRRALTVAVGDGKLAQSALRYHYERSKLQMLSSSSLSSLQHDRSTTSDNAEESSDENDAINEQRKINDGDDDGDYTVYECPGLAPTAEMEVHNPFFDSKCHRSSSGGSNIGQP